MPSLLSAHPSLSIPDRDAFQLQLTPFNSTQGDALDDVEAHVAKSAAAARGAERSLTAAREHQKKGRRKVFAIVGIAVACVVVVALIAIAGFV